VVHSRQRNPDAAYHIAGRFISAKFLTLLVARAKIADGRRDVFAVPGGRLTMDLPLVHLATISLNTHAFWIHDIRLTELENLMERQELPEHLLGYDRMQAEGHGSSGNHYFRRTRTISGQANLAEHLCHWSWI
jgi:hypothetical protein